MRFLCFLVEFVVEALKLMTLKLGDPKTSAPLRCADQRWKHQFEHRSERRLGSPAFLLKESLQQVRRSDGAPMGRWGVQVSDTGLKVLLEAADSRGHPL
jgi:hypothetical protein